MNIPTSTYVVENYSILFKYTRTVQIQTSTFVYTWYRISYCNRTYEKEVRTAYGLANEWIDKLVQNCDLTILHVICVNI